MLLKIRNDIDLKELEKYGFSQMQGDAFLQQFLEKETNNTLTYFINKKTLKIEVRTCDCDVVLDNTIYDLIKDNLIEKVDD